MITRILVIFFALVITPAYANTIQPGDHQPLPDIRWQDDEGSIHHLSETNGKPRVLHFWAAWCVPCRKEMPEMIRWQQENSDISVIPLSLDQRMAQTKHFIKKHKLSMAPLLINEQDSKALGIPVVPYTILISATGLFVGHYYGIAPWEDARFSQQIRQQFGLE